jgi:hypothetical protein
MRLNRYLALCGLGSRRKVEALITRGLVSVNGVVQKDLATVIDPAADEMRYMGKVISPKDEKIYIILNKPTGYVVTQKDEYDRKTVYDLLPEKFANLPYAGRLDKNSEGLLLFTDDGELIKRLTHAKAFKSGDSEVARRSRDRRRYHAERQSLCEKLHRHGYALAHRHHRGAQTSASLYDRSSGWQSEASAPGAVWPHCFRRFTGGQMATIIAGGIAWVVDSRTRRELAEGRREQA